MRLDIKKNIFDRPKDQIVSKVTELLTELLLELRKMDSERIEILILKVWPAYRFLWSNSSLLLLMALLFARTWSDVS
jgi:hypothetical protein